MRELLLSLIGISLLQCILQLILKEESAGKALNLIGGIAMAAILLAGVSSFDYQAYSAALSREQTERFWNEETVREDVNALRRRYIEDQCAAYILERASRMHIELSNAVVTLAWNTDGYWYPIHAEMTVTDADESMSELMMLIESELGIPVSEQVWRSEDESTGSF